jgi:hypothetical protein
VSGERTERTAIPLHQRGYQLGDDDRGAGRQQIERRAQRKSHTESADQAAGRPNARARAHANIASASSEPCIRLDIRVWRRRR